MKATPCKPSRAAVIKSKARFVPDACLGLTAAQYLSRFSTHEHAKQNRIARDLEEFEQRLNAHRLAWLHGLSPPELFLP